jgi:hypothetical protein
MRSRPSPGKRRAPRAWRCHLSAHVAGAKTLPPAGSPALYGSRPDEPRSLDLARSHSPPTPRTRGISVRCSGRVPSPAPVRMRRKYPCTRVLKRQCEEEPNAPISSALKSGGARAHNARQHGATRPMSAPRFGRAGSPGLIGSFRWSNPPDDGWACLRLRARPDREDNQPRRSYRALRRGAFAAPPSDLRAGGRARLTSQPASDHSIGPTPGKASAVAVAPVRSHSRPTM